MRSFFLSCGAFLVLSGCGEAQSTAPISSEISFANRAHHEADVTVTFTGLPARPLELRMSRSSPGRYALHEFAKNVYNVRATGAGGQELVLDRPNPHQWDVADHGGTVRVSYTLYADRADGTYAGIDRTHGHLNMPATFMWGGGLDDRATELTVDLPQGSGWRVATQLASTSDENRFSAPNLAYFLDSPTEVSDHWLEEWTVDGQRVRIALHHAGTDAEGRDFFSPVEKGMQAPFVDAAAALDPNNRQNTFLSYYTATES